MKNIFLFILYTYTLQSSLLAQITISGTSTASTCSANGTITINVTGGIMPYNFILDGVPQATVSQSSYTINGVASGLHQLQVTDNTTATSNILALTVGGNYEEPTLNCTYANCEITAIVSKGRPPFQYAMSSLSPSGPFSAYQASNVFGNIPIVNNCFVRVKDSCDNIYTAVVSVNTGAIYFYPNCTMVDSATYDLQLGASGGVAPYTFTCVTDSNGLQSNSTGFFSGLNGCEYMAIITDACGHVDTFSIHSCLYPTLSLDCIDCTNGTVSVSATGGVSPYLFTIYSGFGNVSNATGIFSGLPSPSNGQYHYVYLSDACADFVIYKQFYCLEAGVVCGGNGNFNGQADFWIDTAYILHNPSYPITVICNTCANHDTVIVTSATQNSIHFDGLLSGNQSYTIIDNCDNAFTILSDCDIDYTSSMQQTNNGNPPVPSTPGNCPPGSGQTPGCGNTLVITCQTPGVSYEVYYQNGPLYAANTTGIFPYIPVDTFVYHIISPTGFVLKVDTFDTSLFFTNLSKDCRSIWVGACPDSLVFSLLDAQGNPIILGNTTGIFNNLTPGAWYQIFAKDTVTFRTITQWVQIDSIGDLEYDIYACRDLIAVLTLPQNAQGVLTPTYTLTGMNTAYSQQNTTGLFPNLPYDTYTLTVTRGNCDTLIRQFIIGVPFNPAYCIELINVNGSFTWTMLSFPPPSTHYGLLNASGNLIQASPIDTNMYQLLQSGAYTFISPSCEAHPFLIPNFPDTVLTASITSICSNLACIQAEGGMDFQGWLDFSTNNAIGICQSPEDDYILYQNGIFIAANKTGLFCNLTTGGNYKIVLRRLGIHIDSINILIPSYQQPNLTGISSVLCSGMTTGPVVLDVNGNGLPFTYFLLNPPAGYSPTQITSNNPTITFSGLPIGTYQFMVYDNCGVSSDFSANVTEVSFTPTWQRYCDSMIQFNAPNYANWTYIWQNSAGLIVGTTYNPYIVDVGAETYTLTVTTPICTQAMSVSTPPFTVPFPPIITDAGADTTLPYPYLNTSASTLLQGNVPNLNEMVQWTQLAPMPSLAVIANPNQSSTLITVTSPGIYTFIYTIQHASCIGVDTIHIHFFDCTATSLAIHAGTDLTLPYPYLSASESTSLQGNTPNSNEVVQWTQIAPMPGVATIATPTQSNTSITVTTPGLYTFVYTLQSPYCTATDTVQVNFVDCAEMALSIDAGTDITLPYPYLSTSESFSLLGNIPKETINVQWTQIAPMPSVAIFSSPNTNATQVTVSSPGVYTFIYSVQSAFCVVNDTIQVNFIDCGALSINANAGADQTILYPYLSSSQSANLIGNVRDINQVVKWQQIAPTSSIAIISAPTQSNTTVTVTAPGIYTFVYTIIYQQCVDKDTIQVNFFDCGAFSINVEAIPEHCQNTTKEGKAIVHIKGGTGPYHYIWDNGATDSSRMHLSTGDYNVTIIDQSGCITPNPNYTIHVPYVSAKVEAYFQSNPTHVAPILLEDAQIVFINQSQNASAYSWTMGALGITSTIENPTYTCTDTGIWKVTLYAKNQYCHDTYTATYHIIPNGAIYIANAFTPNGDFINETFGPIGNHVLEVKFTVYDRWGIIIYQTTSMTAPWNGTKDGIPVPEGAYTFLLEALIENGSRVKQVGTVTLIR